MIDQHSGWRSFTFGKYCKKTCNLQLLRLIPIFEKALMYKTRKIEILHHLRNSSLNYSWLKNLCLLLQELFVRYCRWLITICKVIQKVTVPSIQKFSIPTRRQIPNFSPKVLWRALHIRVGNFSIIPKIMLLYQNHFSELYRLYQIRWGQVRSLMVLKVCT